MENESSVTPVAIASNYQWSAPFRVFGQIVSVIFHPLFIPSYVTAFLLYVDPYAFAGLNDKLRMFKLVSVAFTTFFLPLFSVLLMKQLGFIQSIFLRTQKDRIIPYIVSMIFYFWAWYVARNLHDSSFQVAMLLSVFLGCIAGMMANIYYKVSMHGIAVGSLLVLFLWMAFSGSSSAVTFLSFAILITGLVCTARFLVSDHSPFEIYSGVLIGALCQLIAIVVAG